MLNKTVSNFVPESESRWERERQRARLQTLHGKYILSGALATLSRSESSSNICNNNYKYDNYAFIIVLAYVSLPLLITLVTQSSIIMDPTASPDQTLCLWLVAFVVWVDQVLEGRVRLVKAGVRNTVGSIIMPQPLFQAFIYFLYVKFSK